MYIPNHFLLGATRATSPLTAADWNGAGWRTFPLVFLKIKCINYLVIIKTENELIKGQ